MESNIEELKKRVKAGENISHKEYLKIKWANKNKEMKTYDQWKREETGKRFAFV